MDVCTEEFSEIEASLINIDLSGAQQVQLKFWRI